MQTNLWHNRNALPQTVKVDLFDILTIDQNASTRWIEESVQKADGGRFAAETQNQLSHPR